MKLPGGERRLSIFARTFLLNLASLLLAECIGLALYAAQPVANTASLRVADIARALTSLPRDSGPERGGPDSPLQDTGGPGGPGGPGGSQGDSPMGPPPNQSRGAPLGPPPDDRFEGLEDLQRNWSFHDAAEAPAQPSNADRAASSRLSALLAARVGTSTARVRLFVTERSLPWFGNSTTVGSDTARLRRGFVAGWQKTAGQWRVLEAGPVDQPGILSRQTLLLFALGIIAIVPISWVFARALSTPIGRFAEAARRLGTDPHAIPLAHDGPAEMSAAIDSFNVMQGRITRLLEERSQMVGAIAHDLRTPLMRVAFRVDAIASPLKEKIESDLQEMQLMIAAALDFVRDQSRTGVRERLDFRLLVESVVDDQCDVGHDVTLQGGEPVILHGDPVALRRAVGNLVDNALKYGERARLRLRSADGYCTLEIDDDGPGVPDTLQERVFEPFFRAEASRNRDTGGIGLGLTAVRGIVLDHGGSVTLRNRKDRGLRVIISLPVQPGQD
ncbi:MAG TPA: HAMP domain-containing sensor histidine kinase [Steroidobacteraceae bacterium]|nr:HAMP domain-containing sensor histidine kinase [Steroidobacteraceae bacterium]